ncbi:MAG: response regulator [Phycisphaerae bacterium]|nr:response regulator [Phycisphaerae bacterium]
MSKRVLLVDDEAYTMASMVDHLSDEGFEVESVTDPSQALDALKERRFAALIVDCVMATGHDFLESRRAGVQLIEQIRSGSPSVATENKDIPIIVLTAVCDRGTLEDLSNADVQGVLRKPVFTKELLHKLRSLFEGENEA